MARKKSRGKTALAKGKFQSTKSGQKNEISGSEPKKRGSPRLQKATPGSATPVIVPEKSGQKNETSGSEPKKRGSPRLQKATPGSATPVIVPEKSGLKNETSGSEPKKRGRPRLQKATPGSAIPVIVPEEKKVVMKRGTKRKNEIEILSGTNLDTDTEVVKRGRYQEIKERNDTKPKVYYYYVDCDLLLQNRLQENEKTDMNGPPQNDSIAEDIENDPLNSTIAKCEDSIEIKNEIKEEEESVEVVDGGIQSSFESDRPVAGPSSSWPKDDAFLNHGQENKISTDNLSNTNEVFEDSNIHENLEAVEVVTEDGLLDLYSGLSKDEDSVLQAIIAKIRQRPNSDDGKFEECKGLSNGFNLFKKIQSKDPTILNLDACFSTEKIFIVLDTIKEVSEFLEQDLCHESYFKSLSWFFNTAGAELIKEINLKSKNVEEKDSKIRDISIFLEVIQNNWKTVYFMKKHSQESKLIKITNINSNFLKNDEKNSCIENLSSSHLLNNASESCNLQNNSFPAIVLSLSEVGQLHKEQVESNLETVVEGDILNCTNEELLVDCNDLSEGVGNSFLILSPEDCTSTHESETREEEDDENMSLNLESGNRKLAEDGLYITHTHPLTNVADDLTMECRKNQLKNEIMIQNKDDDNKKNRTSYKKTYKKKMHYCMYCRKVVTNFPRHMLRKHSKLEKVKQYKALLKNKKSGEYRRKILQEICFKSNSTYVKEVIKTSKLKNVKKDLLINEKRRKGTSYLLCFSCNGIYDKSSVFNHKCLKSTQRTGNSKERSESACQKNPGRTNTPEDGSKAKNPETNVVDNVSMDLEMECCDIENKNEVTVPEDSDIGQNKTTSQKKPGRKNYCMFCKKFITKLTRHTYQKHSETDEVKKCKALPKNYEGKKERTKIMAELRRKGNSIYNKEVIKQYYRMGNIVTSDLLPARRSFKKTVPYVICWLCEEIFKRPSAYKHKCPKMNENQINSDKTLMAKRYLEVNLTTKDEDDFCNDNLHSMLLNNSITQMVFNDFILSSILSYQKSKSKKNAKNFNHILGKIKLGCRFLMTLKETDCSIHQLSDCLIPTKKQLIFDTLKSMCKFDETTGKIGVTSLPSRLMNLMRDVTKYTQMEVILNQSANEEKKTEIVQVSNEILSVLEKMDLLSKSRKEDSQLIEELKSTFIEIKAASEKECISLGRTELVQLSSENGKNSTGDNFNVSKQHEYNNENLIMNRKNTSAKPGVKKKSYCIYCKKLVGNYCRHIKRVHKDEKEVFEIIHLSKVDHKQYLERLQSFRKSSNYVFNKKILSDLALQKSIKKSRFSSNNSKIKDEMGNLIMCTFCKGIFRKGAFSQHVKICNLKKKQNVENMKNESNPNGNILELSNNDLLDKDFFQEETEAEVISVENKLPSKTVINTDLVSMDLIHSHEKCFTEKVNHNLPEMNQCLRRPTPFNSKHFTSRKSYMQNKPNKTNLARAKNYCFYCKRNVPNFINHVLTIHRHKELSIRYLSLVSESGREAKTKRRKIIRLLHQKCKYFFFKKHFLYHSSKTNSLTKYPYMVEPPLVKSDSLNLVSNQICLKPSETPKDIIKKENALGIIEEVKECDEKALIEKEDTPQIFVKKRSRKDSVLTKYGIPLIPETPLPGASPKLEEILPRVRVDQVSSVALNDTLLVATVNRVLERRYSKSKDHGHNIAKKLIRDGGNLLIRAQALDKTITKFRDLLKSEKINIVFEAAKELSGLDEKTGKIKFTNVIFRITYVINQAVEQMLTETLNNPTINENDKKTTEKDLETFLKLKRIKFRSLITRWPASRKNRKLYMSCEYEKESNEDDLRFCSTKTAICTKQSPKNSASGSGLLVVKRKIYSASESEETSSDESNEDYRSGRKSSYRKNFTLDNSSNDFIKREQPVIFQKKRWTEKQKRIVILEFKDFIISGTNPGRKRCRELIASCEELTGRTADQVNLIIDNINKGKLKIPPEFKYLKSQ